MKHIELFEAFKGKKMRDPNLHTLSGIALIVEDKILLVHAKKYAGQNNKWSIPKGHIEEGETPEEAAIREVAEETGIKSEISRELGVIDFWFMAGGKRIHKTVHHYLFKEVGGALQAQESEVDVAQWFPLEEIATLLAYPDEKKLIARSGELK